MQVVNKLTQKTGNDGVSVEQLAAEIGVDVKRLLSQFKDAGMLIKKADEQVSEEQKQQLLRYLQQHHGAKQEGAIPEKIVLRRAKTSEIKLGGGHGSGKTVSIQVRKKRTYVKRPMVDAEEAIADVSVEKMPSTQNPVEELVDPNVKQQDTVEPVMEQNIVEEKVNLNLVERHVAEELASAPEEAPVIEQGQTIQEIEDQKNVSKKTAVKSTVELQQESAAVFDSESTNLKSKAIETTENASQGDKTAEESNKQAIKRKEKSRIQSDDDADHEKHKKRRRVRSQEDDRKLETLLTVGANLGKVLRQDDDLMSGASRRAGKLKTGAHAKFKTQAFTKPTAPQIHEVEIPAHIILADLAKKMSVKAAEVIKCLMKMGVMATINQTIDQETAALVVEDMGHKPKLINEDAIEENLLKSVKMEGNQVSRPPVITIMGHVDHGKTTLLDYIRRAKVAASEAGGITQHIGAYHVETDKGTITFLDTPGHAAFTAMRARGAKLTDIVILVVAADDGVMPQTVEAIQHAKAAQVPIVVAVNKMDKPDADPDRIKTELSYHDLISEEWGGDVMFVPISAKEGTGVDNLLDSILLQAEVLELKAVANCPARGVVIESRIDRGRGAVISVLVQQGTLNKGDIILAGMEYGRIRALFDECSRPIQHAGPSIPVEILGLSGVPHAGDDFMVVPNEKAAREVAQLRQGKVRDARLARQAPKLDDWLQQAGSDKTVKTLNVFLKADVLGSAEALKHALVDLSNDEVKLNVIASSVGGINESDVNLAMASNAIIIGFNVRANTEARKLIAANNVDVHYHNIIYDVINLMKSAISGALEPEIHERVVGLAEVREVFRSSKTGNIAGCMVIEGIVKRQYPIRVLRDNVVIFEGFLESLRRFKEDASEVRNGMECGIAVKNYNDIKPGDQIEVFERVEVKREIS